MRFENPELRALCSTVYDSVYTPSLAACGLVNSVVIVGGVFHHDSRRESKRAAITRTTKVHP